MKKCKVCENEKSLLEFYKDNSKKDGFRNECKKCKDIKTKEYSIKNLENKRLYDIEYREKNAEKLRLQKKEWKKNNPDKVKEFRDNRKDKKKIEDKIYAQANVEKLNIKKKAWAKANKDKVRKSKLDYETKRLASDPLYKLKHNIGCSIRNSFKKNGYTKKSRTHEILGCSHEDFKQHIESKFEDWMNWNNYGRYNGEKKYGWDIDHIIPSVSALNENEVIKLNHFTNLQPLCSHINRDIKRDLII